MIPVACQRMITSAHHNAAIWLFRPQLSEHTVSRCALPAVCQWADSISALTAHTCSTHKRHPCSHLSNYILKQYTDSTLQPQTVYRTSILFLLFTQCNINIYHFIAVNYIIVVQNKMSKCWWPQSGYHKRQQFPFLGTMNVFTNVNTDPWNNCLFQSGLKWWTK